MGTTQSRPAPDSTDGGAQVLSRSADGRVEIKMSDLGPKEQEIFRMFADKVQNATGDQSPEQMMQTLHEEIGQHVDEETWMGQAYVRIGIIGVSGAGKSTFINSFRGLKPKVEGAAAVGTTETTKDTTEYPHPIHGHVILVDFPGDVVANDMKEYVKRFGRKMTECDVFLVFSSDRVHMNAMWIARKAREFHKKVLFVRSKFDVDVENMRRDDPDYFNGPGGQEKGEKQLMQKHRQDFVKKQKDDHVDPGDVFIISATLDNIQRGRWDAPALKEAILKQLDIQQKMLLITTCQDYSPTMARAKAKIYRSRAWKVALGVAAGGVIPYAGTLVNAGIMVTTITLFKEGFGLDEVSLKKLADSKLTRKSAVELQQFVDERFSIANKIAQFFRGEIDRQSLAALITGHQLFVTALTVDATIDTVIPFLGGLITSPASFGLAWYALDLVIEQQEKCALALYQLAFR